MTDIEVEGMVEGVGVEQTMGVDMKIEADIEEAEEVAVIAEAEVEVVEEDTGEVGDTRNPTYFTISSSKPWRKSFTHDIASAHFSLAILTKRQFKEVWCE